MRPIDADAFKKYISEGYYDTVGMFKTDEYRMFAKQITESILSDIDEQPTIQPEKAQLSKEGTTKCTTSDLISRQAAIDALAEQMPTPYTPDGSHPADEQIFQVQEVYADCITTIKLLPTIQPVATDTNVGNTISKFIDGLEEIFADLRERHADDSVCGLCEYDGAYMGQSGDWCNECPGFDRDDCFKLSDKTRKEWTEEIIKALPTVQPEKAQQSHEGTTSDMISRTETVEYLRGVIDVTVPITDYDGGYVDGVEVGIGAVSTMPAIQPEPKKGEWIPVQRHEGDTQPDLECPFCKHRIGWFDMGRYCAGCGAKLKGGAG